MDDSSKKGRPGRATAAGLLIGVLLSAALIVTSGSDHRPVVPTDEEAAAAFVGAWERSVNATYVSRVRWQRLDGPRATITYDIVTVRRPPDHLVAAAGRVSGRVGGRTVACSSVTDDGCRWTSGPVVDQLETSVATVRRLVINSPDNAAWYTVVGDGARCFDLRLRFAIAAPPFGERARWCFDAGTGAPRHVEVHHGRLVDRSELVRVSRQVTDDDLDPEHLLEQMGTDSMRST